MTKRYHVSFKISLFLHTYSTCSHNLNTLKSRFGRFTNKDVYLTPCGWFQGEKSLKLTKKSFTSMNREIQQTICYTRKLMKTYSPLVPCTTISSPHFVEVEFYEHPTPATKILEDISGLISTFKLAYWFIPTQPITFYYFRGVLIISMFLK